MLEISEESLISELATNLRPSNRKPKLPLNSLNKYINNQYKKQTDNSKEKDINDDNLTMNTFETFQTLAFERVLEAKKRQIQEIV